MRVAALYDIHGNMPALEAVLAEVAELAPDLVVIGGDVVGGPQPVEALEAVLAIPHPALFVRGNGDRAPDPYERGLLGEGQLRTLASWPQTVRADIDGLGETLFCHATPRSDEEIVTRITPAERFTRVMGAGGADTVVCGHVHVRFDRTEGGLRVINPGSVGMPYEGTEGVAYWCMLGPDIEFRETPYSRPAFEAALRGTGYPDADWFDCEPADAVTEHFEQIARSSAG